MFKQVSNLLFVVVALVLVLSVQAHAIDVESIETLIDTKEVPKIQEAIDHLETHLNSNPEDGEALWLAAKAYLYLGDRSEEDKQEELFEKGKAYAEEAVEFLPTSPHSYFWLAATTGRLGQTRGVLNSLFMVRPMKNALDQALELDEKYADAHWTLSQLYHQAPGFPLSIGSKKLALEHAERSIELDPSNLDYQIQFAVALEYNGEKDKALQVLEDLLANRALRSEPELKVQVDELYADFNR